MKPGPAAVSRVILENLSLDAPPTPLVELTTRIILEQGWESTSTVARERAELWQRDILNRIQTKANDLQQLGRPTRVTFNSSSDYMVQGACFEEPTDSEELKEKKRRRLRYSDYYGAFEELTASQFEVLCGKLIELIGVQNPTVTRRSADEGIDFYGSLSFESIFFPHDLTPTIQKQLSMWLVGQAKHKTAQVGTSEIRDLAGAIALGRARASGSVESPFPDLHIRMGDPVFALFVTTGVLSSHAWRLLKKSGIVGMDGEMIAAFLADREAGLNATAFDRGVFYEWLGA